MELSVAEVLAKKLMHEFNLSPRWRFEFDNSKKRFGASHGSLKKISLSRYLTQLNTREEVEDCIRHEIAHALVTEDKLKSPFYNDFSLFRHGRISRSRRDIHGADWKAKCLITGAKPERCYDGAVVATPKGNWTATCPNCGKVIYYHRHTTKSRTACRECCKNLNYGRWSEKFVFIYRHKDAIGEPIAANAPIPAPQTQTPDHRAAIERMKEQIRLAEKQEILDRIIALETQLKAKQCHNGVKIDVRFN
jgi:predicted SprT family Zn-dependent metalloprotease